MADKKGAVLKNSDKPEKIKTSIFSRMALWGTRI
jgi:hypothetical protein